MRQLPVLIDQGDADPFLPEQLQPEKWAALARQRQWPLTLRIQPGYDHILYRQLYRRSPAFSRRLSTRLARRRQLHPGEGKSPGASVRPPACRFTRRRLPLWR